MKNIPLTENEYQSLVTLEYVLTQGYSDNRERDEREYMALSKRKWDNGVDFDIKEYYKKIAKTLNHEQ